jgi:hypothetical protein
MSKPDEFHFLIAVKVNSDARATQNAQLSQSIDVVNFVTLKASKSHRDQQGSAAQW